jgi:hypothetical protein
MTGISHTKDAIDLMTVAAMAAVVFLGSTLLHEAVGHGGACLAVGGQPQALGAFYFDCDGHALNVWANRAVAAAGNTVNLLVAIIAWIALGRAGTGVTRLFWWLAATINGFVWSGYFLFSGLTGVGDWGDRGVLQGVAPVIPWRIGLAIAGGVLYFAVARGSARLIVGVVGSSRNDARAIAWTAYFTGGCISVLIGLMNPVGIFIVLVSAAASSFGGTSGLLWLVSLAARSDAAGALAVPRSWGWLAVAVAATAAYALLLGRSIAFPP